MESRFIVTKYRVSSSYFFLFFEHIPIFSYLLNETSYFSYFLSGEANVCYKIENEIIVMCFRRRLRIKQVVIYHYFIFIKFSSAPIVHLSSNVVH